MGEGAGLRSGLAELCVEGLEGRRAGPGALRVEDMVDRDAQRPRGELALATERGEARRDAEEDLLGRVARVGEVAEHAEGHPVHGVLDAADEGLERAAVSRDGARGEGFVGLGGG